MGLTRKQRENFMFMTKSSSRNKGMAMTRLLIDRLNIMCKALPKIIGRETVIKGGKQSATANTEARRTKIGYY